MKLEEYFQTHCVNVKAFCKKADVSFNTLYKILNGGEVVLSIALKVQRATDGNVTCIDMEPLPERRNKSGRKRKI